MNATNNALSLVEAIMERAEKNAVTAPEDYIGEDGFLHCGKCRGAKQVRISVLGTEYTAYCLCPCGVEAEKQEEEERLKRERMGRIRELRVNALDRKNHDCRFETSTMTKPLSYCRRYAEAWEEKILPQNIGLLLWGDCGRGKSYAASCIVNELVDRCVPCLQTSINDLVHRFRKFSEDTNTLLDEMSRYKLLVLDDLGTEGNSEFVLSVAFSVINARYNSGLPLIVTTNLPLEEMKNAPDMEHRRLYDRILEMCTPICFAGENFREKNAEEKRKTVKNVFNT